MKPKMMMMPRASSLETVNRSWTLVAAFTLRQLTNVRVAAKGRQHKAHARGHE